MRTTAARTTGAFSCFALLLAFATGVAAHGMHEGKPEAMHGAMHRMMEQMADKRGTVDPEAMHGFMHRMMEQMTGKRGMEGPEAMHRMMERMAAMGEPAAMAERAVPRLPPVKGFAGGAPMFFVHPEASDPGIAETLGFMMGSPVAVVPSLAKAPDEMLADVYVFTNGVSDMGPLGFQPDVFDAMPGEEGYSPLRRLNLVTWQDPAKARVLKSASAVREAQANGEVSIERPGVVINMPVLKWRLGRR